MPEQNPALDLDHLQVLAEGATPGPWHVLTSGIECGDHWYVCAGGESIALIHANDGRDENQRRPDALFIAAARTAIPALIERVRQLEDAQDRDALAKVIEDAIEIEPHHRRLYPDLYAARVAEAVARHLGEPVPDTEEDK